MKLRNRVTSGKIALDMTPMIDVVFQLLIFFMCTLKVIEPEGDFDISMPLGAPSASTVTDAELPPFKVRMEADGAGDLRALYFNGTNLGAGEQAFARLNDWILFRSTGHEWRAGAVHQPHQVCSQTRALTGNSVLSACPLLYRNQSGDTGSC